MWGKPDYVFQEVATGRVLIVEVKGTRVERMPSDGWPDVRCQLWAYAQADVLRAAPQRLLACEVWDYYRPAERLARGFGRWDADDFGFDFLCRRLFAVYQSHFRA